MKKTIATLCWLALSGFLSPVFAGQPASVFITAGQSNAEGRALSTDKPVWLDDGYGHLKYAFVRTAQDGKFGDFSFGKTFAFCDVTNYLLDRALDDDFYSIKCTYGGTSITPGQYGKDDGKKPVWYADREWLSRNRAHNSADGGLSLTLALTDGVRKCVDNTLSKLKDGYDIKAIMWHQGESDRRKPDDYYRNFKEMITFMREKIYEATGDEKDKTLPFIFGTVPHSSRQYSPGVEAAQLRVTSELPEVYAIDLSDMNSLKEDVLHFDGKGTEYVGKLMFNKLVELGLVDSEPVEAVNPSAQKRDVAVFTVNPEATRQTIDCFGASDAWSMRFIGEMPEKTQEEVADLLFSRETDAGGNPEGIGLSIWRFNIGAGSVEQGDASGINNGTRTECFLGKDGKYDWNKQAGQRSFLRLAKERGVPYLLGFLNSPPVWYTKNGLATNTGRDGTYNLREDRYDDYARFMADVIAGLKKHDNVTIDYISPVNEPDGHWNWQGPKQEGTPATKYEIARLSRLLDKELQSRGMDTQIIIPESSDYRCMMSTHETGPERGYEIQSFFSPDSTATYVGGLKNLPRLMAGHSYWTNTPVEYMKECRKALRDTLRKHDVDFWQSEVCIMGNDEEIGGGGGYDRTMKTALYVARMIHHDLVFADARSWQWWRAVGGDYKDGLLFQYREPGAASDTIVDSRLLWSLGNYSRFIRPGAVRLDVTRDGSVSPDSATDPYGLMCSAYRNEDGSDVVVVINYGDGDETVTIDGVKAPGWSLYRTSDKENERLSFGGNMRNLDSVDIPGRSITTFISK